MKYVIQKNKIETRVQLAQLMIFGSVGNNSILFFSRTSVHLFFRLPQV